MQNYQQTTFKKRRNGPESRMVDAFLERCETVLPEESSRMVVLIEPIIGPSLPDVLVVCLKATSQLLTWRERFSLPMLRTLHLLSTFHSPVDLSYLSSLMGVKVTSMERQLRELDTREIVQFQNGRAAIIALDSVFVLTDIIAVEAKVKNWKTAFDQAKVNHLFSSYSYVFLPEERVSNAASFFLGENGPGLMSIVDDNLEIVNRSKRFEVPSSVYSWLVNEYVVQMLLHSSG